MAKEAEYSPFDAPVKGQGTPPLYNDNLKKSLEKAVETEKYEDAVTLRNAISKLENGECLSIREKIMCDNILYPTPSSSDGDKYSPFDAPVMGSKKN